MALHDGVFEVLESFALRSMSWNLALVDHKGTALRGERAGLHFS